MKRAIVLVVAGFAGGVSANAADVVVAAPPPVVIPPPEIIFTWSGVYVGASGGYTWHDMKPESFGLDDISIDTGGAIVTGFFGYDYQFRNNIVLGIEAEFDYGWDDRDESAALHFNGNYVDADGKLELEWGGSLRARAGYAFDKVLIYATGGWRIASGKVSGQVDGETFDSGLLGLDGWTVGAGVDYAFTRNLFGRLEYTYADYLTVDHAFNWDNDFSISGSQNIVTIGLGYKF